MREIALARAATDLTALRLPLEFGEGEAELLRGREDALRRAVPPVAVKAHQRRIREVEAEREPREVVRSLAGCRVERVSRQEAEAVILRYEWLGSMGRASVASYGLRGPDGELLGVTVFGHPSAVQSRDVCGQEFRDVAVCLERGACVHWAPRNAASRLISEATRLAAQDEGWRVFFAYADPEAGEIGTVYQACGWLYLGQGVGREPGRLREEWRRPSDGRVLSSRALRHLGMRRADALVAGWEPVYKHPKHKYVHFEGGKAERKVLRSALRYPTKPYPKRAGADIAAVRTDCMKEER